MHTVGLYELRSLHRTWEQYSPSCRIAGRQLTHGQRAAKEHKVTTNLLPTYRTIKTTNSDKKLFGLLGAKLQDNKTEVEIPVNKRKCDLIGNTKSNKNISYDWNFKIIGVGLENER